MGRVLETQVRKTRSNNLVFACTLVALFAVSFAFPVYLAGRITGLFANSTSSVNPEEAPQDELFPEAASISGTDSFIRVANSAHLDPPTDKDFLMTVWIRLRNLPPRGERIIVLQRFDQFDVSKRGYAIALERDGDVIRPLAYWRSLGARGGWHAFAEAEISAKQWVMLSLCFYSGRYLGMHAVVPQPDGSATVTLLGGVDLGEPLYATSSSDLLIGAPGADLFRGKIGSFGILAKNDLASHLKDYLEEMGERPGQVPNSLSENNIRLWAGDAQSDQSKFQHKIEFIRNSQRRKDS
ncbi:MAG: hypothetical protein KDD42_09635 [Bdellovibrionales bacterium]|nr:hypothetical protein [Bdellovibrionales bacterium]